MKSDISCRITRTLLMYVRDVNNGSLGHLLDGLDFDKNYLIDPQNWVSHSFLQILYKRMIDILGDENAVYKMALASKRFQSLGLVERIGRLLGNLKLIYAQAPRYNKLLKLNGDVYIHEMGDSWVILEDRYHDSAQKTRYDCDYTRGVLAGIPAIFDMPLARVEEIECQVSAETYGHRIWPDNPTYGCSGCLYLVQWDPKEKLPLWKRLFHRYGIYRKAIDDLVKANQTIQEKYDEIKKLASKLESTNNKLITSKQQLESNAADLEASERRYRLLAEHVSDIIWTLSLDTMRFTYISPSVKRTRGFTPQKAMELGLDETLAPESMKRVTKALREELAKEGNETIDPERTRTIEIRQLCSNGEHAWAEATMTFIRNEEGRPVGILGVARDIVERKQAEEALNAEKERLSVTLQSIGDGVITTDRMGRITLINRIASKLTGWTEPEALGMPLENVFPIMDNRTRQQYENVVERFADGKKIADFGGDTVLISRDGNEYIIAESGAPILDAERSIIGLVLVFRDITENKMMENELLKIEKLESLALLAGGIAHDFNNLLTGIIGNLSLARLDIDRTDTISQRLEEMEKASLRAKALTEQLLTFSKGGDPVKRPMHLMNMIKDSALFALRGSNIRCDFSFQRELFPSEVDEGQLSQVIHNLILNAIQAMPEGGLVHLRGKNIQVPFHNELSLREGDYVRLTFQDEGIGIKKQDIKRVFDPYFTTKQKGSGLGLAVAYAIIKKHNGRLTIDSEVDIGTTCSIYLPAIHGVITTAEVTGEELQSGVGTILVMDDEDFIREIASQMLKKLGFTIMPAKDGEEALQLYRQAHESGRSINVVILDLTIPGGMGGKETIKKLLEIDKNVKVIVASGYSNDPVMSNYSHYGFRAAVKKPYRIQELGKAIQSVLNEG